MNKLAPSLVLLVLLCAAFLCIDAASAANAVPANTQAIRGINWADPNGNAAPTRDLEPSGLTTAMTATQAGAVARSIARAMKASGGTTIRMPISYGTTSDPLYWPVYKAAVKAVVAAGCNVDLAWWAYSSGVIDNGTDTVAHWQQMWGTVNRAFKSNPHVLYEPINEPYGYSAADLDNIYAGFIGRYKPVPYKCIFDGTGYATGIADVGGDSRMDNQYLGLHRYFWFNASSSNWVDSYNNAAADTGSYAARTVVTEMGVETFRTVDFFWQWQQGLPVDVAFLTGTCAFVHDNAMGSIAWSGVNDIDSYRWFMASNDLVEVNPGVANMFRYSWDLPLRWEEAVPNGVYMVQNLADGNMLDNLGYTANGSVVGQWQLSGSSNQYWDITYAGGYYTLSCLTANMCLDTGGNTANGSSCEQYTNDTSPNQQWMLNPASSGYYQMVNSASGVCIDTAGFTGNGSVVQLWSPSSSTTQQWRFLSR